MRFGHEITIERRVRGALGAYGVPAEAVTTIVTRGYLEQRARSESASSAVSGRSAIDREVGVQEALLLVPLDVEISETDTVLVDGVRWQVSGPPWQVRRPSGDAHHVEVTLREAR